MDEYILSLIKNLNNKEREEVLRFIYFLKKEKEDAE